MLSIRYLYNSGFMLELDRYILIFDYYPGPGKPVLGELEEGLLNPSFFPPGKEVVFLISHAHRDHYTPQVLEWCRSYPLFSAVLSFDVPFADTDSRFLTLRPHETVQWRGLSIQTLRSTDEGIAFLIQAEGLVFYHAGDLNWWHWFGEDDQENQDMGIAYQTEIQTLSGSHIDYAFLPLDPRLEAAYDWGVRYFLETVDVRFWIPMHFGEDPRSVDWLKQNPEASNLTNRMIPLTRRGRVWHLLGGQNPAV